MHEYAARRLEWLTRLIPGALAATTSGAIEGGALDVSFRFYSQAQLLFAPNVELCDLLAKAPGAPAT